MIYGDDLAHVHDVEFGATARDASRVVLSELRAAGLVSGLVVDLGCGSGVLAGILTDAGYDVVGVDVSPSMIRLAEAHAPSARFVVGPLHRFAIPPCVAVTAVGEALSYLAPGEERVDLRPLFGRVWKALVPGGLLLFDVIEATTAEPMAYRVARSGPDWDLSTEVTEDLRSSTITRNITVTRRGQPDARTTMEVHRAQTFERAELRRALTEAGFRSRMLKRYGKALLLPRRVGVCARKPRT